MSRFGAPFVVIAGLRRMSRCVTRRSCSCCQTYHSRVQKGREACFLTSWRDNQVTNGHVKVHKAMCGLKSVSITCSQVSVSELEVPRTLKSLELWGPAQVGVSAEEQCGLKEIVRT